MTIHEKSKKDCIPKKRLPTQRRKTKGERARKAVHQKAKEGQTYGKAKKQCSKSRASIANEEPRGSRVTKASKKQRAEHEKKANEGKGRVKKRG
jgi:hypothetical protein